MAHLLLIGTKKGLFLSESNDDRRTWKLRGPYHRGREVHHAIRDVRSNRLFAAANDAWFGPQIALSDDLGATWRNAVQSPVFGSESGRKLEALWHLEPGRAAEPETLYCGVAPAALFRSQDGGETWAEMESLNHHPTRPHWHPGAGGLCLHSIQLDPTDAQRMFVGISAVGVFRTEDGGQTWQTANRGTRASFMPDPLPEFGQCVHKLLLSRADPTLLFQQNHCGVYRSSDHGQSWQEITAGLPSDFGFPLAVHPREPRTIYTLPLQGGDFRCPPEGRARVFRTRNGGESWETLTEGLPQEDAYFGVLREGMAADDAEPAGIYFGTNTGKLFASRDEGDHWTLLADNLPPITSVEVSTLA